MSTLAKSVLKALGTRLDLSDRKYHALLKSLVERSSMRQFARVRVDNGDTIYAASMLTAAQALDNRDSTYAKVCALCGPVVTYSTIHTH